MNGAGKRCEPNRNSCVVRTWLLELLVFAIGLELG